MNSRGLHLKYCAAKDQMLYSSIITIELDDVKLAETLYKALVAEARNPANRGKISVEVELANKTVMIRIRADTLTHLRAVVNSFLYLAKVVLDSTIVARRTCRTGTDLI